MVRVQHFLHFLPATHCWGSSNLYRNIQCIKSFAIFFLALLIFTQSWATSVLNIKPPAAYQITIGYAITFSWTQSMKALKMFLEILLTVSKCCLILTCMRGSRSTLALSACCINHKIQLWMPSSYKMNLHLKMVRLYNNNLVIH